MPIYKIDSCKFTMHCTINYSSYMHARNVAMRVAGHINYRVNELIIFEEN